MRQPGKPRWKRWILAATAAISMAGAGAVMTTPDVSVAPPPSDSQNELQVSTAPGGVQADSLASVFNNQAQLAQMAQTAASTNDLNSLQAAVKQGYNLHEDRDAVLRFAALAGSYNVVQYALANGADVNAYIGAPLEMAVLKDNLKMAELLVANGADPTINNSGTLLWTVLSGQHTMANYLIDHGAKVSLPMITEAYERNDKAMIDILTAHAPEIYIKSMFPPLPPSPRPGL